MNILITGGEGDIAKGFKEFIVNYGYKVYNPSKKDFDVTNENNVEEYIKNKKIDILINNAGYIIAENTKEANSEKWLKHLLVNLYGAFLCSKYVIKYGGKTIINIGSTSGFEGKADWGAYCASKAGIISLTETLANENIEAYSLNIGRTNTKMRDSLFPNEDKSTLMSTDRINKYLYKILTNKYKSGNHLILTKESFYILPQRKCPK